MKRDMDLIRVLLLGIESEEELTYLSMKKIKLMNISDC